MNKCILFFLSAFFLFSCGESPEAQTTPVEPSVKTEKKSETQPSNSPSRRSNYAVVTSRPQAEIEQKYPYNINITNANKKEFNSKKAFKTNGKPTVLLFWLTTCVPCHYEMDAIQEKYAEWQQEADFNFYAISTDFQKNYDKFIAQNKKYDWPWEVYHDTNREFRLAMPGALNGLPQTFVLDENGEIVYHKRKYRSGDEDALFEKVKELAMK